MQRCVLPSSRVACCLPATLHVAFLHDRPSEHCHVAAGAACRFLAGLPLPLLAARRGSTHLPSPTVYALPSLVANAVCAHLPRPAQRVPLQVRRRVRPRWALVWAFSVSAAFSSSCRMACACEAGRMEGGGGERLPACDGDNALRPDGLRHEVVCAQPAHSHVGHGACCMGYAAYLRDTGMDIRDYGYAFTG